MFKEIEYIRTNHSFKRTKATYLHYASLFIIGPIMVIFYGIFAFSSGADPDERIGAAFMSIGFTAFLYLAAIQWKLNYKFEILTNELTKEENLKNIIKVAKKLHLNIVENNVHRTIVTLKGRTTSFSLGSFITLIYSEKEVLVNSRPTTGISPSPFFRLDYHKVIDELMKAGSNPLK